MRQVAFEERGTRLAHHAVAMSFLQSLERGDDLFAVPIAARPQSQLPSPRRFEHRQLDPQLGDGRSWLPFLYPLTDKTEKLGLARQRMADDGLALVWLIGFVGEPHSHLLRARAAQAQLGGKVAAQRAGDEQQRLAIFHRRLELPMRARELRWAPWDELIRFSAAGQQDG